MGLLQRYIFLLVLFIASLELAWIASASRQQGLGEKDIIIGSAKMTVRVFNNLGDNLNMNIHCKSKDDDLGVHDVANGGEYQWRFKVNFWGTTLFFCHVAWQGGQGTFDFYRASRDMDRCKECIWSVKPNGVYGYKKNNTDNDLWYRWQ